MVSHDLIQGQGQGHGGPTVADTADFKAVYITSAEMHAIKRLTVNYHIPRQYLHFNRTAN